MESDDVLFNRAAVVEVAARTAIRIRDSNPTCSPKEFGQLFREEFTDTVEGASVLMRKITSIDPHLEERLAKASHPFLDEAKEFLDYFFRP